MGARAVVRGGTPPPPPLDPRSDGTALDWTQGKATSMRLGVPMVWRKPKNHHENCYFCMVDMTEWNQRKKKDWYYPDIESARRPVPHCAEVPVPVFTFLPDLTADETVLEAMEDSNSCCSNCSSTSMAAEASSP